ncbi:peptidylprolyl isomerase [Diaminobutyricimonas aerilata]|uniref:peptidylprolyl isomerase n=1 Tax=Diaminobutyricimonas aerilata TaxID=1162967 RepID=A0A2M9CJT0_9MICO|nr:FKBP-type peptidyl-prolyl cis-trans isomerase [Diaminobutyricimonas aerilata]PJJ72163.1 peptidylprolyl isomerase [Diaminobutyricimonas aerilata]
MRTIPALIAVAVLGTTLVACSSPADPSHCTPTFPSGQTASVVEATGRIGQEPDVSFPTPLVTKSAQVTTVSAGDGSLLQSGEVADLQISLYAGTSGDLLTSSSYDEAEPVRRTVGAEDDMFAQAVECATVGSRVAFAATVEDIYGADQLNPELGLGNDDTLVAVIDVERGYLGKANGANQLAENGLPAVVTAPDGRPGISVPNQAPPADTRVSVLKRGDGTKVKEGDQVVAHYTGLVWDTGTVFQSSWDNGIPATLPAVSLEDDPQAGLVPGFADAIIGSTVGSQLLIVIAPEDGYPEGSWPQGIPEGSTMVFVVDVLGIQ